MTLDACPDGGGPLAAERVACAATTAMLPLPRPQVTPYRVAVCRCPRWGKQGRGPPPDGAPEQYGAPAHRGGARAMAAAHGLPDGVGMPVRQVPVVWEVLPGRTRTPGASTPEAMPRVANPVGPASARLRPTGPAQPVVHPDDPGGRVGGAPADLRAFETDVATGSQIRSPQRSEDVQEGRPADDDGGRGTDRGRSDDAPACDEVTQQKCLAHLWRSSRDVGATQTGRARDGGERRTGVVQDAMPRWRAWPAGAGTDWATAAQPLWAASTPQLRPRLLTAPDHHRRLTGSGRQPDRGHLRRFLAAPQVEPTHKRAARVVRPAVSARQGSQCSKNQAGAQAVAACKRVGQTLAPQGVNSMVEGRYGLFRSARPHAAPP